MKKEKYESPKFEIQEMRLLERVAEKCWGLGYAFIDHDANPITPPEKYWFTSGGCDGKADADRLQALINAFPDLSGKVTVDDVKANTKDSQYIDFPENAKS